MVCIVSACCLRRGKRESMCCLNLSKWPSGAMWFLEDEVEMAVFIQWRADPRVKGNRFSTQFLVKSWMTYHYNVHRVSCDYHHNFFKLKSSILILFNLLMLSCLKITFKTLFHIVNSTVSLMTPASSIYLLSFEGDVSIVGYNP